jgi:GDPmannose 4,6-dehydratase
MSKTALITGATGQDAAYLAHLLLSKNYKVYLTDRRVSTDSHSRFERLQALRILNHPNLHILNCTLTEYESMLDALRTAQPDEIYHLAAQSFVQDSFRDEWTTYGTNFYGTLKLVKAWLNACPNARLYNAATSEMFGQVEQVPQTERTPFHPRSPYGISKLAAFEVIRNYREQGKGFCCSGLLFNHESPLRGHEFVTRKIVATLVKIAKQGEGVLELGNIDARRDWGHSRDYVEAMWLMLQQHTPADYVICSGETYSIEEFLNLTIGIINNRRNRYIQTHPNWRNGFIPEVVSNQPEHLRKCEVDLLIGNATKAHMQLKWKPKCKLDTMIEEMVHYEFTGELPEHTA